ncbi:hypothetical protein COV92_01355, partial [Candidatus Uhrbacteria bacterium CG11_big_fil_rev_8_21_14_0_20_41_9]
MPQKIILHLDFNSYFASVEQQANPFLRGKAIAIAGKGVDSIDLSHTHYKNIRFNVKQASLQRTVVTTASKEAKKLGVKTAMSSLEARRIAPELIIIPGDPKKYSEVTDRFLKILNKYCDKVEQFSTDEAFADITNNAGDYFGATMLAQMIRNDIRLEIGEACTVSIGIAPNKLVAKLAGESVKPNGITIVPPKCVDKFILSRKLDDICGIGRSTERQLHSLGITTMKTLRETSLKDLVAVFKEDRGYFLYFASRGIGDDEVNNVAEEPKSIGHSYTFPHDLDTDIELQMNLLALCDKVAWRMRRDGFVATEIGVCANYKESGSIGAVRRCQTPMEDGLALFKSAWAVLDKARNPNIPIRLLG